MSIKVINLNKLLKLCALTEKGLISAVRTDLRAERDKADGVEAGGGDFHGPFWSDAKLYVLGAVNLTAETLRRIDRHGGRQRLYPLLERGFLTWFEDLKRGTNETVAWLPERVHNHHEIPELGLTIKVDNLLGLKIGHDKHRLVYPYFCEKPILSEKWARVGLWLMREALDGFSITSMEILDVLRARSFAGSVVFLKGDEEAAFASRYEEILELWNELRPEYGL
jgi:hypothetical protein